MKACTTCHRLYPDDGGFCPIDGCKLLPTSQVPLPQAPDDKRVGKSFCGGRYQIWRIVADGGMGRVYQALDLERQRSVALKVLHEEVAADPVSLERFRREFKLSASLPHDYIVDVLAFERTEDKSYALVMEYLEGEELRMLLKREKTVRPERVVRMLSQLALGLAAAHERKVVHRDLKPDNIFLCGTREGDMVKILDFGSVRDNSAGAKKLTVMGTTIGSPYYMAPEQAQGLESLDHRADVWSAAAIAYECLTGTVPFQGNTGPAILLSILTRDPVPPSEAGKQHGVPVTLDEVMEEALAKDHAIRIASIGALADRVGAAYGLEGTHVEWARMPEPELAERIAAGLPAALARHRAVAGFRAMDAAMRSEAPGAGPAASGVPAPSAAPAAASRAPAPVSTTADDAFAEDIAMGVPTGPPKWLFAAIAGAAVVVGVIVAFLIAR